jgi:M-phase inducer tyrosine phosphatase
VTRKVLLIIVIVMDNMQAFLHSHLPVPAPAQLIRATQCMKGTQDNVDEPLSSELDHSFASAMSLNSPLRGHAKLVDELGKDVVPMDISPEPSRFIYQLHKTGGNAFDKVTRARAFTSSTRPFGRDLSNEFPPIPSTAPSCESENTGTNRTQRLPLPVQWEHRIERSQSQRTDSLPSMVCVASSPILHDCSPI